VTRVNRKITFSDEDQARIHSAARALNTTQREFVQYCVRQGLDEIEGVARESMIEQYRRETT
jgi:hypothetical protein